MSNFLSEKYGDVRMPTEWQRQELCKMIYHAFIEIRILGWQGKAEQSADLADAFHNLPIYLWDENFSLGFFKVFLESYQAKYPIKESSYYDYLQMLDKIVKEEIE